MKHMEKNIQIVVATAGWVYVGEVARQADGSVVITNAKNIRRWGTTNGLGQLAADGPQPETKLDDYGTVQVPANALISLIQCDPTKWT